MGFREPLAVEAVVITEILAVQRPLQVKEMREATEIMLITAAAEEERAL
jgi:hypothetical protein